MSKVTHASHEHVDPLKSYIIVFISLIILLILTVVAYHIPFERFGETWGMLNTAVALLIATIKATLVVLVFMHLRHGTKLTWVIASAGFIWLCIMVTFFFADYLSRGQIPEGSPGADGGSITLTPPQAVHRSPAPFNGVG